MLNSTYSELEGLDQTNGLVYRAANWEIVDSDLAEDTLGIDDEETTKSDTLILKQDIVGLSNLVVGVRNQGKLKIRTETALVARLSGPGEVRVLGVRGRSYATRIRILRLREK